MQGYRARCYCGATQLEVHGAAQTVAMCHCADCKRWTGAPAPAFAAFDPKCVSGLDGNGVQINAGVRRWNCNSCGSPLAATFDYLPQQIYLPLGIIENADDLVPQVHCFANRALPWLHMDDDIPKENGTARDTLLGD